MKFWSRGKCITINKRPQSNRGWKKRPLHNLVPASLALSHSGKAAIPVFDLFSQSHMKAAS